MVSQVRACAVRAWSRKLCPTMHAKSSETVSNPQSVERALGELLAQLETEFGSGPGPGGYEGPPFGMFRELDFATLPPLARQAMQVLGRNFWQIYQCLEDELGDGAGRPAPSLEVAASAVAAELEWSARALTAACSTERPSPSQSRDLLRLGLRSVKQMKRLAVDLQQRSGSGLGAQP